MAHKTDEQITQGVLAELAWDPAVKVADLTVSRDIAADIRSVFALDYQVPDERISVSVVNGYVTLTGNVDWYYQKGAAEKDVARIPGVQGLDDEITVKQSRATAAEIASGIAQAFQRNARLYDDHIKVTAEGGHVTLSGTAATWSEFAMAEEIARMAPGVSSVTNQVAVLLP